MAWDEADTTASVTVAALGPRDWFAAFTVTVSVILVPEFTLYVTVKVPDDPAPTLAFVQTVGKPAQFHPGAGVIDTNVAFAGVSSVNVAVVAAADPILLTICVNATLFPSTAGTGDATLLTVNSAPATAPTTVEADAVLLLELGSLTAELTLAVSVITVPFAVPAGTLATRENVAAVLPGMFKSVQITFPVPPTDGVAQVHPDGAEIETNVVPAGIAWTKLALSAALGPLLVMTCV